MSEFFIHAFYFRALIQTLSLIIGGGSVNRRFYAFSFYPNAGLWQPSLLDVAAKPTFLLCNLSVGANMRVLNPSCNFPTRLPNPILSPFHGTTSPANVPDSPLRHILPQKLSKIYLDQKNARSIGYPDIDLVDKENNNLCNRC